MSRAPYAVSGWVVIGRPPHRAAASRLALTLVFCLLLSGRALAAEPLVIHAARLHSLAGPAIEQGVVVVQDGRIAALGRRGEVDLPSLRREIEAAVVTPGLIDVHTSVGISGLYNVPADRDQDEATDPDQADLQVRDAFNPNEPLLRYLLEHGVTLVQTAPGPVTPIAGQAGVFRTHGTSADAMAVRFPSALIFNLGEIPKRSFGSEKKFPSTRMGTAALIRRRLREGHRYAERSGNAPGSWLRMGVRREEPDYDAALEVLGQVATGRLPAIFTAHRADDILTAARIANEFSLRASIAGGTEAYLVADALRAADIPILVGPVMERVSLPERQNASYENAAILSRAGVSLAIRSGFESYVPKNRLVLFEAAIAAANGLGPEAALRAITLDAAELLDLAGDYGSLEVGKVADLVLFDGDPFEYTTHVEATIAAGEVVYRRAR